MTSRSPTSIDGMLSSIPKKVRAALKAEFHLQVKTAYTRHLNDELAAVQATVPQAALPPLPQIVTEVTPAKTEKPVPEISGSIPGKGKQKASDAPPCPRANITNSFALFANTAIAAIASAAVAAVATAVTTTAVTTTAGAATAAAGTSPRNALGVPGTSATNALEVLEWDSDDTNDTIPPRTFQKQEHGLTIIHDIDINDHLKSIKSDLSIIVTKPEPGTYNTNYVNGIHFLATVLTITEAPVVVKNLLPDLTNIGSRKDVRTTDIIGFLTTNGVKLTHLSDDYETIMRTDHASPIIIEYSVARHTFESTDLPSSWLQFCILFKKEKLLVPFNQKGEAINLGNQFNEQKWTKDFYHYCHHNLNFRIAPVDRVDKKGSHSSKSIIRGLSFNDAWAITMPSLNPKP
jgi:hypothetical protein